MHDKSLFGEIVTRFRSHPENIATEALLYVLTKYDSAQSSLKALLEPAIKLDRKLSYRTQEGSEDGSIPDLIGVDADGDKQLVVEAKFWAGLTPRQPVTYLENLPDGKPAMLLFVTPGKRFNMLWQKLLSKAESAGLELGKESDDRAEFRTMSVSGNHLLAILSWRALLAWIRRDAEVEGNTALVGDLDQLSGLCSKMDGDAFLPLTDDDFSPAIGMRFKQFADIVDRAVEILGVRHNASTQGPGGHQCIYGRNFQLAGRTMFLNVNPIRWARAAETPIWLRIACRDSADNSRITDALHGAFAARKRITVDRGPKGPFISIHLPVHCEQEDVLNEVVKQVLSIVDVCCELGIAQAQETR